MKNNSNNLTSKDDFAVCLFMIVKNESKIISRCFDSAFQFVDFFSICDTGSTDNTVEVVKTYFEEKNVKGKIYSKEWINFGHNRTESYDMAVKTAKYFGYNRSKVYFLTLDADQILRNANTNKKKLFDKNPICFDLSFVYDSGLIYPNSRLFYGAYNWKCCRRVHEFWTTDDVKYTSLNIGVDTVHIYDYDDGGNHSSKFEREKKLLLLESIDMPKDRRTFFYLGRTYSGVGKDKKAIKYFLKSVKKEGSYDEKFYAYYNAGLCYLQLNKPEKAFFNFLLSMNVDERRMEPLYEMIKYCRLNGKWTLLKNLMKLNKKEIPFNALFVETFVYEYKIDYEYSIAAYYLGENEKGRLCSEKILSHNKALWNDKFSVLSNIEFYIKRLNEHTDIKRIDIGKRAKTLFPLSKDKFYTKFNPFIAQSSDRIYILLRNSNYTIKDYKYLIYPEGKNTFLNKMLLLVCNNNFDIIEEHEIVEPKSEFNNDHIKGFEDVRITFFNNSLFCVGSSRERNSELTNKLYSFNINLEDYTMTSPLPLISPENRECEKNWLPYVENNEIKMIYDYSPLRILDINAKIISSTSDNTFNFRGSTSPIKLNEEDYLFVVHSTVGNTIPGKYFHRFVIMRNDKILKYSNIFYLYEKGIEYISSLAKVKNNIYIGYGSNDENAYIISLEENELNKMNWYYNNL